MDPQAALYDLLDAMQRGDRAEVDELLDALKEWNKKDGFMPQVEKVERFDYRWMQVSRKVNP